MKLKLLLSLFLFLHAVSPRLVGWNRFETTFVCDIPGIKQLCVSMYYTDLDSSSTDDPLLWFQACSNLSKFSVFQEVGQLGGDGGFITFYYHFHYEVAWLVYHTCTEANAANTENQLLDCECTPYQNFIDLIISSNKTEHRTLKNVVYWPHQSYPLTDSKCDIPEGFKGVEDMPQEKCSWDGKFYAADKFWSFGIKTPDL